VYQERTGSPDAAPRGSAIAPVRGDSTLSKSVSTVDDVDLVQGRISAVISLEQVADATVGQYGYGQGASAPLPDASS
jgi:hypothetical protein